MAEPYPEYYRDLLLAIYPSKVPFTLAVKDDKPKKRVGTYYLKSHRIILHSGWEPRYNMVEAAIHEYAHHIHDTEFEGSARKQAPHGKEFWQIYGQLMGRARALGIQYGTPGACALEFPEIAKERPVAAEVRGATDEPDISTEESILPEVKKILKVLSKRAYEWLNRED